MFQPEDVQKRLAHTFGLKVLNTGYRNIHGQDGVVLGNAFTPYIWYAEIIGWWKGIVYISSMQSSRYLNDTNVLIGSLLIAQSRIVEGRVEPEWVDNLDRRSVRLQFPDDLVANALHSVDLLEEESLVPMDEIEIDYPHFHLHVFSRNGIRSISYTGGEITSPSWKAIWDGLIMTLERLIEAYDDPSLRAALRRV